MKICECGAEKVPRIRHGKKSGWYCRPCANVRANNYRLNSPDAYLNNKLWTFYRIRLADFRQMLDEQGGCCAACRKQPDPRRNGIAGTGLVIDHDHSCCPGTRMNGGRICGKCVRGLLCQQCNVALGMVNDSTDQLQALIAYVEQHQMNASNALATRLTGRTLDFGSGR